jgi:5-methylcytosine-specific restriction endonuclease McrA
VPSSHGPRVDAFYHSAEWKKCRDAKIRQAHGVCEKCGKVGTEVHHIIPLTEANIDDPSIRIGLDNMMLLCKPCHDQARAITGTSGKRCVFDESGRVTGMKDTPPVPSAKWSR